MKPRSAARMERLQYVDEALLLKSDLETGVAQEARRAALHVRGLHDTWGVATGLRARWDGTTRTVIVDPGAAFDCRGNVVSLSAAVVLKMPETIAVGLAFATFDLILNDRGVRWELSGGGAGSPNFGAGVGVGSDIPLARFVRVGPALLAGPDYSLRKSVRSFTRPYVRSGVTAAGELTWSVGAAYLRAVIDTSVARFSATPFYLAQLLGPPALPAGLLGPSLSLGWFGPQRFVARVYGVSAMGQPAAAVLASLSAVASDFRIAWTGIEPQLGCSTAAPGGIV
jgi:hypothetical protein